MTSSEDPLPPDVFVQDFSGKRITAFVSAKKEEEKIKKIIRGLRIRL